MSLNTVVVNAIDKAFVAAGDLVGTFTLRKVQESFDPATSTTITVNADTSGQGVIDDEKTGYMGSDNLTNKYITIWLKVSVEPEVNDILIDVDFTQRQILEVNVIRSYNVPFLYELKLTA